MQQTRLFGQTFNWISKLPFVWQVFAFLFPTAAAAMTAWLASIQGEPWHLVIFYGLGAGAFATVTYAGLLRLAWDYTLKHKLYIDEFIPMILNEGGNRIAATFKCVFSNISDFPLEIVLEHPSFSLQDNDLPGLF